MTSIGKISANFLGATNENTAALASLKFDFSLVKLEAPKEFHDLGAALTTRRRNEAEEGSHHQTARRLGALFEQKIPSTPKLIKMYGLRASKIVKTKGLNVKGTSEHGPFESYVGIDGTAMWAAATSGIPALGVYLLACLLARAWDANEAVGIWDQIVKERRQEIAGDHKDHNIISESSRMSVSQPVSRQDLRRLDASARAWLQSADQAHLKQQTQLMLIAKNIALPFSSGSSPYHHVMQSWQHAMTGLDQLLLGKPQVISNRAILLAFSAWHLYPDLIILAHDITKVNFHDPYADPQGVGTLAFQPRSNTDDEGMQWSLALSHLRYYGDPVVVKSELDFSRVSIHQLHIVALGALFNHWRISSREISEVAQWFVSLRNHLRKVLSNDAELGGLAWLHYFAEAAHQLLSHDKMINKESLQLLAYGRRRATKFLGDCASALTPFFGLCNPYLLAGLSGSSDDEFPIAYLREFARSRGLRSHEAFIGYSSARIDRDVIRGMMTAIPHTCVTKKRNHDGNHAQDPTHVRWLNLWADPFKTIEVEGKTKVASKVQDRLNHIRARGECGILVSDIPDRSSVSDAHWPRPSLFEPETLSRLILESCQEKAKDPYISLLDPKTPCCCQDVGVSAASRNIQEHDYVHVMIIGSYTLYVLNYANHNYYGLQDSGSAIHNLSPSASITSFEASVKPAILLDYLRHHDAPRAIEIVDLEADEAPQGMHSQGQNRKYNYTEQLAKRFPCSKERMKALRALSVMTQIYQQLDGAMISLKAVEHPVDRAEWFSEVKNLNFGPQVPMIPRANVLSCIVFFESGSVSLEPEVLSDTLAIASGNSLFVIGPLLSDPLDVGAGHRVNRITGNIGRPGICLLVPPGEPRIRALGSSYNLVEHATYDGRRENNFGSTSLHLSFTGWEMPVEATGARAGFIDQSVHLVESVISVLDAGNWVADIDILSIDLDGVRRLESETECPGNHDQDRDYDYTSIDSWEELLDGPAEVGFFRAQGNWVARLAALSILYQKDQGHSVGLLSPQPFCLDCLAAGYQSDGLSKYESPLPSICID